MERRINFLYVQKNMENNEIRFIFTSLLYQYHSLIVNLLDIL